MTASENRSGEMDTDSKMKLWFLEARRGDDYDCMRSCVVRAETERAARAIAASVSGDEGEDCWLEEHTSSCVELIPAGLPGTVCVDFHEG